MVLIGENSPGAFDRVPGLHAAKRCVCVLVKCLLTAGKTALGMSGGIWACPQRNQEMVFMKKFLFAFVAALVVLATSGCDSTTPWGVEYSLNSTGKTDASVELMVFNGSIALNGDANYVLDWNNVPKLASPANAIPLKDGLLYADKQTVQAAEYVNGWLDEWFKVVSFEGHYDIYIKGYVKETKTQITFSVDRHFTNIEE